MSSTPLLIRAFIVIGDVIKYFGIFMLAMFVVVMVIISFELLLNDGIKYLVTFWIGFFTFWNMENLLILFVVAGPFVFLCISAGWLKKYYKERIFKACADKVFIEQKDGKAISLTYEELGLSIRTRKVKIGPDWIEIPYDTSIRHVSPEWIESPLRGEKIRLYSFGKKDTGELLAHLFRKCDIPWEKQKMEEKIEVYKASRVMTYFIGWPILLISVYILGVLYFIEEYKSVWELVKAVPKNHIGVAIGVIIGISWIIFGYIIKLLLFGLLRCHFKPYKDYFHISL